MADLNIRITSSAGVSPAGPDAMRLIAARSADDGMKTYDAELERIIKDMLASLPSLDRLTPADVSQIVTRVASLVSALATIAWALPIAAREFERIREDEGGTASDLPMTSEWLLDAVERMFETDKQNGSDREPESD